MLLCLAESDSKRLWDDFQIWGHPCELSRLKLQRAMLIFLAVYATTLIACSNRNADPKALIDRSIALKEDAIDNSGGVERLSIGAKAFLSWANGGVATVCSSLSEFKQQNRNQCSRKPAGVIVSIVAIPRRTKNCIFPVKIEAIDQRWSGYVTYDTILPIVPFGTVVKLYGAGDIYGGPSYNARVLGIAPARYAKVAGLAQTSERIPVIFGSRHRQSTVVWVDRSDLLTSNGLSVNLWKI
jgi:hypothetical protein